MAEYAVLELPSQNPTDEEAGFQQTGNLRFLVHPNTEPKLQQEFVNRKTYELIWKDVPFVHVSK